jgi:hypothetical protein
MLRSRQARPSSTPATPNGAPTPKGAGGPGKNWAVAVAARTARMVALNILKVGGCLKD